MSQLKLDRSRPFAIISGDTEGRHFEQDNRFFNRTEGLWRDPKAKESKDEREAREKAEADAVEAARLQAEADAKKAAGGDDQLTKQLSGG